MTNGSDFEHRNLDHYKTEQNGRHIVFLCTGLDLEWLV